MELQEEDSDYLVSEGEQFGVLPSSIVGKWEDYSSFCNNMVNKLGPDQQSDMATSMGEALLNLCEGVSGLVAECDSNNDEGEDLPAVLPKDIVLLQPRVVNKLIARHSDHLLMVFEEDEISKMEDEFCALKEAYHHDPETKTIIDSTKDDEDFETAWMDLKHDVTGLHEFYGGIATIFPATPTVEADFSELKWAKDAYSMSLSDFSFESKLQCRQFDTAAQLVKVKRT